MQSKELTPSSNQPTHKSCPTGQEPATQTLADQEVPEMVARVL
jgi:hypothetical protein